MVFVFGAAAIAAEPDPDWKKLSKELKAGLLQTDYSPKPPAKLFTKIPMAAKQETWCFVGDTGVENPEHGKVAETLLNQKSVCNRIYHLGDLVYPTGIKSSADPQLKSKFLKFHAPFEVPFFYVLGDHEYYALEVAHWIDVPKKHKNLFFPYYYYAHESDGICVVAADTTPYYRGAAGDPRPKQQSEWFEKTVLPRLSNCKFKILISHHSYETMNTKRKPPLDKYKKPLRDFFDKYVIGKFDLIVSGHDHALAFVGTFGGTDQFISGAGGKFTSESYKGMDFANYVGHRGPGVLYFQIQDQKPFKAKLRVVALEGKSLSEQRLVYEKIYERD